jgi:type I restriction enzyme R subunit
VGQTAANAIHQYRHDRDPREPIFVFTKRTLVHFAVDTEEAHMATRLAGSSTHFCPSTGADGGAGNPPDPMRAQLQDGLPVGRGAAARQPARPARALSCTCRSKRSATTARRRKESLIFPRYHQLQAVRQMVASRASEGVGHNYLVEHSAGSGKSNTIAWLAHRLSSAARRTRNQRLFDSVVVVTDRVVLDRQLQDTIYQFDHKRGVVQKIDESSRQLAEALEAGVPIIITTLQKFPFVSGSCQAGEERGEGGTGTSAPAVRRDHRRGAQLAGRRDGDRPQGSARRRGAAQEGAGDGRGGRRDELERAVPQHGQARPAANMSFFRLHRHAQAQDAGDVRPQWQPATATPCARRSRRASSSTC